MHGYKNTCRGGAPQQINIHTHTHTHTLIHPPTHTHMHLHVAPHSVGGTLDGSVHVYIYRGYTSAHMQYQYTHAVCRCHCRIYTQHHCQCNDTIKMWHSISLEQSAVWMAPADSCLGTDKLASAHGNVKQIEQIRQESLTESSQMFDCYPSPCTTCPANLLLVPNDGFIRYLTFRGWM